MFLEDFLQLAIALLPLVFVWLLKEKKLFILTLILSLEIIFIRIYFPIIDCSYCSTILPSIISGFFYFTAFFIGLYAFIKLLVKNKIILKTIIEENIYSSSFKKTTRFFGALLIVIFISSWVSLFFGNGLNELKDYVLPFVLSAPLLLLKIKSTFFTVFVFQFFVGLIHFSICLLESYGRKVYIFSLILFYVLLSFVYLFSLFIFVAL